MTILAMISFGRFPTTIDRKLFYFIIDMLVSLFSEFLAVFLRRRLHCSSSSMLDFAGGSIINRFPISHGSAQSQAQAWRSTSSTSSSNAKAKEQNRVKPKEERKSRGRTSHFSVFRSSISFTKRERRKVQKKIESSQ